MKSRNSLTMFIPFPGWGARSTNANSLLSTHLNSRPCGPSGPPSGERGRTTMKISVRGVSLFAALVLTLTACGGGGNDTKGAASRLPGGGNTPNAATPSGGSTESSAPAPSDTSAAPAAGAPAATSSGGATPASSATPAAGAKASGGASTGGGATAAGSGSTPAGRSAAGSAKSSPSGSASPGGPAPAPTPGAPGAGAPGAAGDKTGVTQSDVLFGIHMPLSGP